MNVKLYLKKIKLFLGDKKYRFNFLHRHGFYNFLPDKTFLKKFYRIYFDKKLDIKNPKTFNEKLQWLKIHDHNPAYCRMVDKVEAKDSNAWR